MCALIPQIFAHTFNIGTYVQEHHHLHNYVGSEIIFLLISLISSLFRESSSLLEYEISSRVLSNM